MNPSVNAKLELIMYRSWLSYKKCTTLIKMLATGKLEGRVRHIGELSDVPLNFSKSKIAPQKPIN